MRYPGAGPTNLLIQDLALRVPAGAFVSLLGRSGAGKTTLLRIIAGLETRYDGKVFVGDTQVAQPSRDVQLVFQDYRLLPWKTVYENIAFAANGDGTRTRGQVERWLAFTGLLHRRDALPRSLSGGEAGQVALARALVSPPRVLLLDEPFRNLDFVSKYELQDHLLRDLQVHRPTVLLVSHSIEDAVFLSDELYLLEHSPLRVLSRLPIDLPRPRARNDPRLAALTSEVLDRIAVGTGKDRSVLPAASE
jgi:sulfonate transport system ATP-binding protein